MSDNKEALDRVFGPEENPLIPKLKDAAILAGWIAGLILIAGLCWFLTQPVRSRFLMSSVNKVLEQSGDSRRLGSPVSSGVSKSGMGSWYTIETYPAGTTAYIFAFIAEGTFFPCAAVVSPQGKVQDYIPLNNHGQRLMKRISPGILGIYTRRIEGSGS